MAVVLSVALLTSGLSPAAQAAAMVVRASAQGLRAHTPVLVNLPTLRTTAIGRPALTSALSPSLIHAAAPIVEIHSVSPLPPASIVLTHARPLSSLPLVSSIPKVIAASDSLSRSVGKLPSGALKSQAGTLFNGIGAGKVMGDVTGKGGSGNRNIRRSDLKPSPGTEVDSPAPEVPSPAKKVKKSGFKKWHKWVVGFFLVLALTSGGVYLHFRPHIDTIRTDSPTVVVVEKTVQLLLDVNASISRSDAGALILAGQTQSAVSVSASNDGKMVVTVAADGSWRLWDLENGTARAPQESLGPVAAAKITSDGRLILIHQDTSVHIIELATGKLTYIAQDAGTVKFHSFSPDGRKLAISSLSNRLQILDLKTGAVKAFGTENVLSLAFTSKGVIFMTTNGPKLRIWVISEGNSPKVIMDKLAPGVILHEAAISADGSKVAAAGEAPGTKGVLFLSDQQLVGNVANDQLGGRRTQIASIAMNPAGTKVAILTTKGKVWLWLPVQDELELIGRIPSGAKVFFNDEGTTVFTSDQDGGVHIWKTP